MLSAMIFEIDPLFELPVGKSCCQRSDLPVLACTLCAGAGKITPLNDLNGAGSGTLMCRDSGSKSRDCF